MSSTIVPNGSAPHGGAVHLTLTTMVEQPLAFAVELERRAALKRARDRRYRARKRRHANHHQEVSRAV